jgi:hypothetical protein
LTRKTLLAASAFVLLLLVGGFFVYYVNSSATLSNQENSISKLKSSVSSLAEALQRAETMRPTSIPPWSSSWYLNNDPGCTDAHGYGICFGSNLSAAVVFHCAQAAASPAGCATVVNSSASPHPGYEITIWFPRVNQTNEPSWANCEFNVPSESPNDVPEFCISLSSSDFIIAMSAPPPE